MTRLLNPTCLALTLSLGFGLLVSADLVAGEEDSPPNWKVSGDGVTTPDPDSDADLDAFSGESSHLGRYTGTGVHILNPDATFDGEATYTAANGDQLFVIYSGELLTFTPPFEFEAEVEVVGGTGRLSDATGSGVMTGAFTGVPGDFYFDIEGTLHPQGQ